MGKSGDVGVGGKSGFGGQGTLDFGGLGFGVHGTLDFGGLGVGGRKVVRLDEGKGILDDDMSFHSNIDDAAERLKLRLRVNSSADHVKLPLCESLPQGPGSSHPSTSNDNEQTSNANRQ